MLFSTFDCSGFGYADAVATSNATSSGRPVVDANMQWYLHSAMHIRCSDVAYRSPEHDALTDLAAGFIVLWPVGMPLLLLGLHPREGSNPERVGRC